VPGVTWDELWGFVQTLPGCERGTSYGTPSFKVKGKFMARLWEDGETLVLRIDFETVDVLLKSNPDVFFITDHYVGYPAVLVRLRKADFEELSELLETSWRLLATKKLIAEYDG